MYQSLRKLRTLQAVAWITLFFFVGQPLLFAAGVVIDPTNPEVRIEEAPNGTPIVQIKGPNGQGLSHNKYIDFNVGPNGLILNNSRNYAETQLAGWIDKNPNMGKGAARVILNEVTSTNRTNLNGFLEVAGHRADVIIANPNGIVGTGFGFINTDRATLTTGNPMIQNGALQGFRVSGGEIELNGQGMNGYGANRVDLLSHTIKINSELYAHEIQAVSGANQINYQTGEVVALDSHGSQPTVGIDVAALGGMYAGRIRLVGTENGVGVHSAGAISATGGDLTITSAGKIVLNGQTYAQGNIQMDAQDNIEANQSIFADKNASLTSQNAVINRGTLVAGDDLTIKGKVIDSDHVLGAGINEDGSLKESGDLTIEAEEDLILAGQVLAGGSIGITTATLDLQGQQMVARKDISLTATQSGLDNGNGQIIADRNISIQVAGNIVNHEGNITARENLTISGRDYDLDNISGKIGAGENLSIEAHQINNAQGQLGSDGNMQINAQELLGNGKIVAGDQADITVVETFTQDENSEIRVGNVLNLTTEGRIENAGKILSGQEANLQAKGMKQEASGVLSSAVVDVEVQNNFNNLGSIEGSYVEVSGKNVTNRGGIFADHIRIDATTLTNNQGVIAGGEEVDLFVTDTITNKNEGLIWAGDTLWIAGSDEVDTDGLAVDRVQKVENISSSIEGGNLVGIFADELVNKRTTFEVKIATTKTNHHNKIPRSQWDSWMNTTYSSDPYGTKKRKTKYTDKYEEYTQTEHQEYVTDKTTRQSEILSGKDMIIRADLVDNHVSHIMAVDTLDIEAMTLNNEGYDLTKRTIIDGNLVRVREVKIKHTLKTKYKTYRDKEKIYDDNTVVTDTVDAVVGGGKVVDIQADLVQNGNLDEAGRPIDLGNKNSQTSESGFTLPNGGLYTIQTDSDSKYLVETDPRFTRFKDFISSDYMLDRLLWDPEITQKRLGDAFYEQQLVRNQIAELTGRYYLGDYNDMNDQYLALLTAGVESAEAFGLAPGVKLSAAQMSQLTQDIVWMEEQVINGVKVLVPVVYLSKVRESEMTAGGSIISANQVNINAREVATGGVISGTSLVNIKADNIVNRGEITSSKGMVNLKAEQDIRNESGRISGDSVQLVAGNDIISTTTKETVTGNQVETTRLDQIASIQSKNDLVMIAENNVQLDGTRVSAGGDVGIKAGNDISMGTVTYESKQLSQGYDRGGSKEIHLQGGVEAGGKIQMQAENDITLSGTQMVSKDSIVLQAGNDVTIQAVKDRIVEGHYSSDNRRLENESVQSANIVGTNDVTILSGNGVMIKASNISSSEGQVGIQAAKNVTITTENELHKYDFDVKAKAGGMLSKEKIHIVDKMEANQSVGSNIYGNEVVIKAGEDMTIHGSQVLAEKDVSLQAEGDINITASKDEVDSYYMKSIKKSGLMSGGTLAVSIGTEKTKNTDWSHQESYTGSTVGSLSGDVSVVAGKDVNIVGSNVTALTGDIHLEGQDVNIVSAVADSDYHNRFEYKKSGITVGLGGTIIDPLKQAYDYANISGDAKTDELKYAAGAKAIFEANKGLEAAQGYTKYQSGLKKMADAQNNIVDFNKDATQADWDQFDQGVKEKNANEKHKNAMDITLNISVGSQKYSSSSDTSVQTHYGSDITAGGDVTIVARGEESNAKTGDINVVASNISGKDVTLQAQNEINVLAGQDTQDTTGKNKSSGWSVGVDINLTAGGFQGVGVSASGGKGKVKGDGTTHIESTIEAKDTLAIQSGADTNIIGSQVKGDTVKAEIGGDLNIQTLQDTDNYHEKQTNWNISVSGIGTGGVPGVSGGYSQQKIDSEYKSAQEQAGIYAGEGGFDIEVGGNTNLKGAVISSEADADKNKISTETLTWSDLKNEAEWESSTSGINISLPGKDKNGNKPKPDKNDGITPNFAGSDGEDDSTTKSGISEGTIDIRDKESQKQDIEDLNRDTTNTNDSLDKIFDKDKILEKEQAAALFGEIGFTLAGDIISKNDWKNDDPRSIALHGIIGGIMAEISGGSFGEGMTAAAINKLVIAKLGEMREIVKDEDGNPVLGPDGKPLTKPVFDGDELRWISAGLGGLIAGNQGAGITDSATTNNFNFHELSNRELKDYINQLSNEDSEIDLNTLTRSELIAFSEYMTNKTVFTLTPEEEKEVNKLIATKGVMAGYKKFMRTQAAIMFGAGASLNDPKAKAVCYGTGAFLVAASYVPDAAAAAQITWNYMKENNMNPPSIEEVKRNIEKLMK